MKTTIKCDQPGCDYERAVNPKYAAQTIGRHKLFAHNIKGTSKSALERYRYNAKKAKPRNPEVVPAAAAEEQPAKRVYTKRAPAALSVSLCPVCGCNIQAVNVAINLRGRHGN